MSSLRPLRVPLRGRAIALSAGAEHTCAATVDGTVWCWGSNGNSALGIGDYQLEHVGMPPQRTLAGRNVRDLASLQGRTCALTAEGAVWCWGGYGGYLESTMPLAVQPDVRFRSISVGWRHTCGMTLDDRALCWGPRAGEPSAGMPAAEFAAPEPLVAIAAGDAITCGLSRTGRVHCQ